MPKQMKKVSFSVKKEEDDEKVIKAKEDVDTFNREDCDEKDYNDDGGLAKRRKKKGKGDEQAKARAKKIVSTDFLPNSMKQLRACIHCKIVLNQARWKQLGKCPNCPSSGGLCETTYQLRQL